MKFINGLYKDKYDERDILVQGFLKEVKLPIEYDLSSKQSPVRNQGQRGSCCGFAGEACKEYFDQIDYDRLIILSPEFIYSNAQIESGHVGEEGTTLRAVMKVLKERGACEEYLWPYGENMQATDDEIDKNASRYKIKTYARVLNLKQLKESLVRFSVLLAGIYVFKSIYKTGSDGVVPEPNMMWPSNWRALGGHAIAIVGYSDYDELVKFKNSWGENWGKEGYGFLSYKYINNHMVDCYSMVDVEDAEPYRLRNLPPTAEKIWV